MAPPTDVPEEIYDRLRLVEASLQSHLSACGERWKHQADITADAKVERGEIKKSVSDVSQQVGEVRNDMTRLMTIIGVILFIAPFVAQWWFSGK